jgi:hypothetical protein
VPKIRKLNVNGQDWSGRLFMSSGGRFNLFTGAKYITQGVKETLPSFLQNILWYLIETMDVTEKDYLQVFDLSHTSEDGKMKQTILHTQEQPPYRKEYFICTKQIVAEKIFIIDDYTHCTMLLASEY